MPIPRPMPPALATPLVRPTDPGSRRGCRSSSAAAAALSARPVARPWMPRATNSHAVESASANNTLVAISVPSEASRTGRRPISSDSRPARRREASTPKAYVA